jgi:hypothetical protein
MAVHILSCRLSRAVPSVRIVLLSRRKVESGPTVNRRTRRLRIRESQGGRTTTGREAKRVAWTATCSLSTSRIRHRYRPQRRRGSCRERFGRERGEQWGYAEETKEDQENNEPVWVSLVGGRGARGAVTTALTVAGGGRALRGSGQQEVSTGSEEDEGRRNERTEQVLLEEERELRHKGRQS